MILSLEKHIVKIIKCLKQHYKTVFGISLTFIFVRKL